MKKNEVIHYENGKRVERIFYRSGELMCEIIFENEKKQGVEKIYDKNGNVIKETPYENGELKTGEKNEQNRMD